LGGAGNPDRAVAGTRRLNGNRPHPKSCAAKTVAVGCAQAASPSELGPGFEPGATRLNNPLDTACDREISGASKDASGPADQRRPGLEPDGCVVPSEPAFSAARGGRTPNQRNPGSADDGHASRGGQIRRQRANRAPCVSRGRTVRSHLRPRRRALAAANQPGGQLINRRHEHSSRQDEIKIRPKTRSGEIYLLTTELRMGAALFVAPKA
jgi:hypothetical protein